MNKPMLLQSRAPRKMLSLDYHRWPANGWGQEELRYQFLGREDPDGSPVTFEGLCSSSTQNRSIPELSYYIHVDAWTFSLWFQPWQSRGENLIVCECHLDRAHEGILEYQHRWEDVILCEPALVNEAYYGRLVSRPWTCIQLFNGVYGDDRRLHNPLVVDWKGDIAHRIGVITLRGGGVLSLDRLPGRKRQRIRLR